MGGGAGPAAAERESARLAGRGLAQPASLRPAFRRAAPAAGSESRGPRGDVSGRARPGSSESPAPARRGGARPRRQHASHGGDALLRRAADEGCRRAARRDARGGTTAPAPRAREAAQAAGEGPRRRVALRLPGRAARVAPRRREHGYHEYDDQTGRDGGADRRRRPAGDPWLRERRARARGARPRGGAGGARRSGHGLDSGDGRDSGGDRARCDHPPRGGLRLAGAGPRPPRRTDPRRGRVRVARHVRPGGDGRRRSRTSPPRSERASSPTPMVAGKRGC